MINSKEIDEKVYFVSNKIKEEQGIISELENEILRRVSTVCCLKELLELYTLVKKERNIELQDSIINLNNNLKG